MADEHVVLLSVPGLRARDLDRLPRLSLLMARGEQATLTASFPCVTWPVQTNMLTGRLPFEHGVVANGFYWRDKHEVEMWTAGNDRIACPQIWDVMHDRTPNLCSAVWFPMLSKGCGADFVCMPAPVHNPDGSESLWCYTKPRELYGELRDEFGHFPLQHFWGPLANIEATAWIARSAVYAARRERPNFFYVYLPHLDYAAQRSGPDSEPALAALGELDQVIGELADGFAEAFEGCRLLWLAVSEYVITPVDHVVYPNRLLRQEGLLEVREDQGGEVLDWAASRAWALVDHQFSHVFVREGDAEATARVQAVFRGCRGIAEVLAGNQRADRGVNHERSGDVVLISEPNSWQAYYWWFDDAKAPDFARTVNIHRKPGYDPVELHLDAATKSIPLDATLVRGSHGAPVEDDQQLGVLLASRQGICGRDALRDIDVADLVLQRFGIDVGS